MDEKNERKVWAMLLTAVNNAVDCSCLGMDEKNERKVWAMLLTAIV
jgi:hypothetical protein